MVLKLKEAANILFWCWYKRCGQMRTVMSFSETPVGGGDYSIEIFFARKYGKATWVFGRKQKYRQFGREDCIQEVGDGCKRPIYLKARNRKARCLVPGLDVIGLIPADVSQRTEEWFALRRNRLTTSSFGKAIGFWKGGRAELWEEKVFVREEKGFVREDPVYSAAMSWGIQQEPTAIQRYKTITGNVVEDLGFKIYRENDELHSWLGASPDGLIEECPSGLIENRMIEGRPSGLIENGFTEEWPSVLVKHNGGILEVKCPHNKGRPELGLPWTAVPYYYMPQVQGLMEILDRDWVDFYVWTISGSSIFRICRSHDYWNLIHEVISDFWWGNVVPARQALSAFGRRNAYYYRPPPRHSHTNLVISQSKVLAASSQLICKEIGGHVNFYV